MTTIPASAIVNVTPNVLDAGGSALVLNGLILTESWRVPIGTVVSFANATDVGNYFGLSSNEYSAAQVYFNGFDNSNKKPGAVLFAQYNAADVGAYLRGGNAAEALTLTQLQGITPSTIAIKVNGTTYTSSSINLSTATSFSNAASMIQAAFTTPPFGVTFDSTQGAFVIETTAAGASETIAFPTTSTVATGLLLTEATGAVISQGADATTPSAFMTGIAQLTQNWATFMTIFDPDNSGNAEKLAFAEWTNLQNNRYAYVCWDTDVTPSESAPANSSLGHLIQAGNYSGTFLIGRDATGSVDFTYAAFVCGTAASIDFEETNGRITFAFRAQTGLVATCTNETAGNNLMSNGYNFYGAYATANDGFNFLYDGQVSGPFDWMDSFVNQIWLNNALQLALLSLLVNVKSIPYNTDGYSLIRAACLDPINAGLNFGAIRAGVPLSSAQAAEVNNAAGLKISDTLQQVGWYLLIQPATAQVRAARQSPPCKLWYMDGQSVQKIDLTSINVQ